MPPGKRSRVEAKVAAADATDTSSLRVVWARLGSDAEVAALEAAVPGKHIKLIVAVENSIDSMIAAVKHFAGVKRIDPAEADERLVAMQHLKKLAQNDSHADVAAITTAMLVLATKHDAFVPAAREALQAALTLS